MTHARNLTFAHLWVAFIAFTIALVLGVWQMWARSPLPAPFLTASTYFSSVTAHGTATAYVLTTFMVMGFGYYVAETALARPLPAPRWAWIAFALGVVGTLMAVVTILTGRAAVLFTFYPPLIASVFYYVGLVLVVAASWSWCVLMLIAMGQWKKANPGRPVPLAMFATVANAVMWLWTTVGVAAELLFQVIPAALGLKAEMDVGLSRTLFSWTLHAIVYFWLIPSYIAFYTMVPQAAGGRLYSDTMGRLTFVLFLIYSLPVGLHHLLMDPQQSNAFKFLQVALTALVSVPTLLTVFTIGASLEIAGRLRGGRRTGIEGCAGDAVRSRAHARRPRPRGAGQGNPARQRPAHPARRLRTDALAPAHGAGEDARLLLAARGHVRGHHDHEGRLGPLREAQGRLGRIVVPLARRGPMPCFDAEDHAEPRGHHPQRPGVEARHRLRSQKIALCRGARGLSELAHLHEAFDETHISDLPGDFIGPVRGEEVRVAAPEHARGIGLVKKQLA